MRPIRLLTNIRVPVAPELARVDAIRRGLHGWRRLTHLAGIALRARHHDAILVNGNMPYTILLALFLRLVPFQRCRLVCSDPVMNPPAGRLGPLVARLKRIMLRRVDLFLVHQRDLHGFTRFYGISPERSRYVPFKVNALEVVQSLAITEGDYLFSCGVTNRDWATLGAATRDLEVPVLISTPDDATLRRTSAVIDRPRPADFGANATFVENASPSEWLRLAAGAKFVVLPIRSDAINPSGVSTYLSIMALGKCVVLSDGPASRGIIADEAIIVPPGDAGALRHAIERVDTDASLRQDIAENGRRYALRCEGADRLALDLVRLTAELVHRGALPDLEEIGPVPG